LVAGHRRLTPTIKAGLRNITAVYQGSERTSRHINCPQTDGFQGKYVYKTQFVAQSAFVRQVVVYTATASGNLRQ
jgi:hypothetical protein